MLYKYIVFGNWNVCLLMTKICSPFVVDREFFLEKKCALVYWEFGDGSLLFVSNEVLIIIIIIIIKDKQL